MLRPIEHDHRGRDLGQAADLAFLAGVAFLDDVARLRINHDVSLRGEHLPGGSEHERE